MVGLARADRIAWRPILTAVDAIVGGKFITFEGGEGAGKSTQARLLKLALEARGHKIVLTREPGGSPGAEEIRKLLVQGKPDKWDPVTETLLLFAARADHVRQTIKPALAAGSWVISDRFSDSTTAYQGIGRGVDRSFIEHLESLVLGELRPDLTLILDVPVGDGLARTSTRATLLFDPAMKNPQSEEAQLAVHRRKEARFERFGRPFHEKLRVAFRDIANAQPERCVLIDGAHDKDAVATEVWRAVEERLQP